MFFKLTSRKRLIMCAVSALMFLLCYSIAVNGAAAEPVSSSRRLLPIYAVGRGEDDRIASLSFDAAWGNEDTQTLIDILAKYDVKATFFIVGQWADKYPESVKALSDAGHEIMNHSDTHPHMAKLSAAQMKAEIESCNKKIESITGVRPLLLRAPYGEYNDTLIKTTDELSMYTIQWDVDSLDWKNPTPSEIASRVIKHVKPGSIVLFHNAAVNTPAALPTVIESLQSSGYKLVKISENIYKSGYTIDHEGRQQLTAPPVSGSSLS